MNIQNVAEATKNQNHGSEFERLLEGYAYSEPKRGQILKGEIEAIQEDAILLNVGKKRAAIVPPREIKDLSEELIENLSEGEVIPVYVTRTPVGSESLLVSINKAQRYRNWLEAEKLLAQDEGIELKVTGMNKGGLLVQFDQLEGFVPNSHVAELRQLHNHQSMQERKQKMIGSHLQVKAIEVDRTKRKLVFSAIAAQEDKRRERLQELSVGDVIDGAVTNVVDFGIFVDLGGVDGLVHISELDWQRVDHPAELYNVGDQLDVQVKDIDIERERVSLSAKALIPSPWETITEKYKPGEIVEVKIVDIVDFGAFAELVPGIEGLIHNSELGYTRSEEVRDEFESGLIVLVKILNIDVDQKRISLSMRQVPKEKQVDWMLEQLDSNKE